MIRPSVTAVTGTLAPAAAHPAPAIDDGRRTLTHGALALAAATEASWLAALGVERAGLLTDNGAAFVIADRALRLGGGLNVPLPPAFTDAQLRHALDDAGLDALLTDQPGVAGRLDCGLRSVGIAPASGLGLWCRSLPAGRPTLPAGTVKVTYTSGSTGTPKGVCLTATTLDAVVQSVLTATRPLTLRRHLVVLPLATLLANVAGLDAMLAGGGLCLLPSNALTGLQAGGVDVARLTQLISREAPDSLILVPELLKALVLAAEAGWQPPRSLTFIAVGGGRVAPALLVRADALGLPVYEGYGLSECGSVLCLNTPDARRRGSVGRPLPHAQLYSDARGEIRVRAPTFTGYLGAPAPAGTDFATGDLGRVDSDGYVYVEGRAKNVLITTFGRNVSPEWVEGELLQHAAIGQACVAGDDRPHLAALIVPRHAGVADADIAAAVAATNAVLPEYARIRRHAVVREPFTVASGLLTANGRPRRERIQARHAALLDGLYLDDFSMTPAGVATGA
jgi:long-subunit acyl-CoA synthetase (AMP-forming)